VAKIVGRLSLLVLVVLAAGLLASASPVHAQANWLNGSVSPSTNWNTPNGAIPRAPRTDFGGNEAMCADQTRSPETQQDNAVAAAGWKLFGTYQGGWGVVIVGGRAGLDGMCRPMDYNFFVFLNGTFAGTISPVAMGSRLDGATGMPLIWSGGSQISADFARYTASDALCCPSSTTTVTYNLVAGSGGVPLLVPMSASTSANS
jgi:LppP/LprE lipoprotein